MSVTKLIGHEPPEEIAARIGKTTAFINSIDKRLAGELPDTDMGAPPTFYVGGHEFYHHCIPKAFESTILAGIKSMLEQCRAGDAENLLARCGGATGQAFEVTLVVGRVDEAMPTSEPPDCEPTPEDEVQEYIERAVEESIR